MSMRKTWGHVRVEVDKVNKLISFVAGRKSIN